MAIYKISRYPACWASLCPSWPYLSEVMKWGRGNERMCAFLSHVTVFPCLQQVFSPRRPWKRMWWSMTTWPLGCGESLGFCTATSLEWKEEEPRHLVTGTVSAWLETVCEVSHISQESNYISRERKSGKLVIWHDEKKVVYCLVIFFTSQLVIVTLTEAWFAYTHTHTCL